MHTRYDTVPNLTFAKYTSHAFLSQECHIFIKGMITLAPHINNVCLDADAQVSIRKTVNVILLALLASLKIPAEPGITAFSLTFSCHENVIISRVRA